MTKYKTIDPNTGEEVELPLSLSPYEIMNIVYSFLISVKTPELHFYEEAQKELERHEGQLVRKLSMLLSKPRLQ